jgi:AraC-like DNA-binding protein/quercetin dioxygenase-like cupin family protein
MIVCLTSLGDNFSLLQVLKKKKFIWYNENMSAFERQSVFHNEREVSKYTVIIEPPYPPGWRMNPHRHIQCELSLVKSGSCTIQAGESTFHFQTNDVVFIPGGVLHDFYAEPPQGVEFAVVQFLPFDEELLCHLINNPPLGCFSLFDLSASVFLEFCHKLQREIASLLPFAEVQCRAIIEEMVVFLLRGKTIPSQPPLSPEQRQLIEGALRFMHEHSHDLIHVKDVAQTHGLSPQYFRRLFKQYVGVSPKQYLTTLKIQRSKCLLLHQEHSVTEVAMGLGFGSTQQFSKVFRKITGLSPSLWRKAYLWNEKDELSIRRSSTNRV